MMVKHICPLPVDKGQHCFLLLLLLFLFFLSAGAYAQSITVISPKKGDMFAHGHTLTAKWKSSGRMGKVVSILLAGKGKKMYEIKSNARNTGTYEWEVPAAIPEGEYTIVVQSPDGKTKGRSGPFLVRKAKGHLIERDDIRINPDLIAQSGPDIQLSLAELLVSNPGDSSFAAGRTIYTHSRVRIRIYYRNTGTEEVNLSGVSWRVTDGPLPGGRTVSQQVTLQQGDEGFDVLPWFGPGEAAAGSYTIGIIFDDTDKIDEISEENNSMVIPFTVLQSNLYSGKPNLAFVGVDARLSSDACGSMPRYYTFDATVINKGGFPASIHGNNVIQADQPLSTDHNEGFHITLEPQERKTISFTASFQAGETRTIAFRTDAWEQVEIGRAHV